MGAGDDTVIGGAGNDVANSGPGTDTLVLSGRATDYTVVVWHGWVGAVPRSGGILAADGVGKG
jgi:hypothetical protein